MDINVVYTVYDRSLVCDFIKYEKNWSEVCLLPPL